MNVLFISQCSGNAIAETRRVLDQFAERCGDQVWQTPITEEGLAVVHRLLRKTARKNSAVACHWIHGRNHSEMLWIVGDRTRFNSSGAVPTNTTRKAFPMEEREDWRTAECCRLLTAMAALWHDVGKCTPVFQKKLSESVLGCDAFRHEWVSVRLFQAFVGNSDDLDWLERLAGLQNGNMASADLKKWLEALQKDPPMSEEVASSQSGKGQQKKDLDTKTCDKVFSSLPPLARIVAWLMLGHHHLPVRKKRKSVEEKDLIKTLDLLEPGWGYARLLDEKATAALWEIDPKDLPTTSAVWRERTAKIAQKLLDRPGALNENWAENLYALHLSRLGLMLGDHVYSGLSDPHDRLEGDSAYPLYANTERHTRKLKQKLDEHLLGVERTASSLLWRLRLLRQELPALGALYGKRFRKRSVDARFRWQDKAFELASSVAERSEEQGFFGINMASTGCGKTLANGRICYALSGKGGARFTMALGLRTLTLQTGAAYREKLKLSREELAVLAGDQGVRELYGVTWGEDDPDGQNKNQIGDETGSESEDAPFSGWVDYEGDAGGPLDRWLKTTPGAAGLLNAPVLACTIDHLVPATEGVRGGRQIAPMLRLMTSDLVLDEPDDFDIDDLHALTRLVNWAGMLGSRVLLSSATLTPSIAQGLFIAYAQGREHYRKNRGTGRSLPVICGWFDEFGCHQEDIEDGKAFASVHDDFINCPNPPKKIRSFAPAHADFVNKRVTRISQEKIRRKAKIISLDGCPTDESELFDFWAARILESAKELHQAYHTVDPASGKRISFGLVRMANIDPLLKTASRLLRTGLGEEEGAFHVHICCYHSRYPMLMRSALETRLDSLLNRKQPDEIFMAQSCVQHLLERAPARDHLVLVLATSVAEVGRDHDYDWAVVEPSSMRSLIQLAGRIWRHRDRLLTVPNLHLLERNIKALKAGQWGEKKAVFCEPGFERDPFFLQSHSIGKAEDGKIEVQCDRIDSCARIQECSSPTPKLNLAALEHAVLRETMLGSDKYLLKPVNRWWLPNATFSGELQRETPFRQQQPTETFVWLPDEDGEKTVFCRLEQKGKLSEQRNQCGALEAELNRNVSFLDETSYLERLEWLAEEKGLDLRTCALRFGRVELIVNSKKEQGWEYHDCLGFKRRK